MCVLWQRVAYANSLCLAMRVHLKTVMLSNPVACESIFKSVIFIIINGLWASNKDVTGIKGYLHRTQIEVSQQEASPTPSGQAHEQQGLNTSRSLVMAMLSVSYRKFNAFRKTDTRASMSYFTRDFFLMIGYYH